MNFTQLTWEQLHPLRTMSLFAICQNGKELLKI